MHGNAEKSGTGDRKIISISEKGIRMARSVTTEWWAISRKAYPLTFTSPLNILNVYRKLCGTGKQDLLKAVGIKVIKNIGRVFSVVDIIRCAKANLFSTIYIDLVNHVIASLQRFFTWYSWLTRFNDIWRSIPTYNSIASSRRVTERSCGLLTTRIVGFSITYRR